MGNMSLSDKNTGFKVNFESLGAIPKNKGVASKNGNFPKILDQKNGNWPVFTSGSRNENGCSSSNHTTDGAVGQVVFDKQPNGLFFQPKLVENDPFLDAGSPCSLKGVRGKPVLWTGAASSGDFCQKDRQISSMCTESSRTSLESSPVLVPVQMESSQVKQEESSLWLQDVVVESSQILNKTRVSKKKMESSQASKVLRGTRKMYNGRRQQKQRFPAMVCSDAKKNRLMDACADVQVVKEKDDALIDPTDLGKGDAALLSCVGRSSSSL